MQRRTTQAQESVTLAVAPNGLSGNPLVPGGSAQTVYFKVTNPGSSPVLAPVLDKELAQIGASLYGYSGCLASWYKLGTPMFYQGLNGDGSIPARQHRLRACPGVDARQQR